GAGRGIALGLSHRPLHAPEKVFLEARIPPGFPFVTHGGVENPPFFCLLAPRDGVAAVRTRLVRFERILVDAEDDVEVVPAKRGAAENVPLILELFPILERLAGRVAGVLDAQLDLLDWR